MNGESSQAKATCRKYYRNQLRSLTAEQRMAGSMAICRQLRSLEAWRQARAVLLFSPLGDEPDIWPVLPEALETGKTVALPRTDEKGQYSAAIIRNPEVDLTLGSYGIREPLSTCPSLPLNQLDFTLVPGIAFSFSGGRLGRGKGYYDRLLAQISGLTCGVAFDGQIASEIPMEPHDILLSLIITPTRWHATSAGPRS